MKKVRIFALLAAVVTALMLFFYLNSMNKPEVISRASVLVAAQDIPADTPIVESMVTLSMLPDEAILPDTVSDAALVLGKVAKSEILAGEQILSSKLVKVGESDESMLTYAIEPGMRAITIAVDEVSGVAYMITPGNRVDIFAHYIMEQQTVTGEMKSVPVSELLVENITVLAVDSVMSQKGKTQSEEHAYTTLTLQVTPEQALKLSFSEYTGELRAVLRSPLDEETTNLPSLTLDDILAN